MTFYSTSTSVSCRGMYETTFRSFERVLPRNQENIMGQIMKGVGVVLVTIALFGAAMRVKAEPTEVLQSKLDGVVRVYTGSCRFDARGVLTFKHDETKTSVSCNVGMKLPDQTVHYIVVFDQNDRPVELRVFDEKTKTQRTEWRAGVGV